MCIYKHLSFSGLGTEGERYKKTLKEMKKISKQADDFPLCQLSASDKEKYGSIAMNRIQIIKTYSVSTWSL